jgi:hypothetical protein
MLGYALTHPRRLHAALQTSPARGKFEEAVEAAVGVIRAGPGAMGRSFLDRQRDDLNAMHERLRGARTAFAPLTGFFANLGDLGALPQRLAQLADATDPASLKRAIGDMLDAVLGALLPGGADPGPALAARVLSVFDLLEAPFKAGARNPEALRGFRAATSCRRLLRPFFDVLNAPGPGLDLRGELRAVLDRAFDGMEAQLLRTIAAQLRRVVEQVGPLLEAVGRLSVRVEVRADGPQAAPGADPKWQDDGLPVPHAAFGHPLTITEIIVALVQLGFGFWEMFRTRDWQGRGANVFLHIVGMVWHTVRSLMRIFAPKTINEFDSDFARWLFKDQGDFWIQAILRVLQSIYEFAQAPNNGFLGLGAALLKQHAFMGLPRLAYQFARAVWYFDQRKRDNAGLAGVSTARFMMGLWGPTSFIALLWGMILMPWDGFALEKLTRQPGTMVLLIAGLLVAVAAGYLTLGLVADQNPFKFKFDHEPGTIATAIGAAALGILAALLIMASIESPTKVGVIIALSLLLAGVVVLGIVLAATVADNGDGAHAATDVLTMFLGLLGPGLITIVMGWFIVDDGRDKPGFFDRLKAGNSPYHLPFRSGEGWLVGQGVHGIFSHYDGEDGRIAASSNHWSYDFNRDENSVALAARDGIVVQADTPNRNGTDDQNVMQFMHIGWNGDVDPGKQDEGVLTWHIYVHLSQHRHYASLGQRTPHGQHVADIDDTGRSAQHHLHIGVFDMQSGRERGIPFVFADLSTKERRGFGHIDGKPVSFGMYKSSHAEVQPARGALLLVTDSKAILGVAGSDHAHLVRLDGLALPAALPATVTITTEPSGPAGNLHTHDITLDAAKLALLLKNRLPVGGLTVATANGHDHALTIPNSEAGNAMVALEAPPDAMLAGKQPGPYRLLGERLTLRVNQQATAFWMFGAHRPSITADVALDGGVPSGVGLSLRNPLPAPGTTLQSFAYASDADRGSARAVAAELTTRLRLAGANDIMVGAEPLLVIETRRHGGGVTLTVDGNAALALAGTAPPAARGAGALADIGKITRDAFATHIQDILANGWGAPLAGITATAGSPMALSVNGNAVALGISNARLASVLGPLYDGTAKTLRADGPLPLGAGRIGIAALALVPLLVRPARVVLDLAHAGMQAATIAATPLIITLGTAAIQTVQLEAGMNAAAVAARIMRDCEGVRAVPDGANRVAIETIACGSAVQIRLSKNGADPAAVPPVGGAAALPGPGIADTSTMTQAELVALLNDARTRATTDPTTLAHTPRASLDAAGKLVLEVNAGKRITVAAWNLPGLPDPGFTPADAADPHQLVSNTALPAEIALTDTGWLDLTIEGRQLRIPFDGAPARVEFPPALRLPEAAQRLTIRTSDVPDATVTFATAPGSLFDVAARITETAPGVTARIAWRLTVERVGWAGPTPPMLALGQPTGGAGLAALGFLRAPDALRAEGAGPARDAALVPGTLPAPDEIVHGPLLRGPALPGQPAPSAAALTSATPPPAAGAALVFTAEPGSTITAVAAPGAGPLAMAVDAGGTAARTAALPDPFPLGGFHQRVKISASAGGTATATTWLALDAAPAVLVAPNLAALPAAAGAVLELAVTIGTDPARLARLGLGSIGTARQAIAAINAAHPMLRAALRVDGRIAIETRRGGTGVAMTAGGAAALRALGFMLTPAEAIAGGITLRGAGNVANDAAVTRAELGAAVNDALAAITVPGPAAGTPPWPFTVTDDGTKLLLRAPGGAVTVGSDPDSPAGGAVPTERDVLARRLAPAAPAPEGTRLAALDGAATVALENGQLTITTPAGLGAVLPLPGEAAELLAGDPLPLGASPEIAAQAAALRAAAITITTDAGSATVGPMPNTVAETPQAIAAFLADAAPLARIVLDATGRLLVASRTVGSTSSVTLDLTPLAGPAPRLGFGSDATGGFVLGATRAGSTDQLPDFRSAMRPQVAALLASAQATGAAPQAVIHADAPAGRLRLTAGAPNWRIAVVAPHPDIAGLAPLPTSLGAVLEAPFAGARRLHAGFLVVALAQGPAAPPRLVTVPLLGRGARLEFDAPANPAALTGATLAFGLDELGLNSVSVPAPASPDLATLCRRLELASQGRLLAEPITGNRIAITTARRGSGARLISVPGGALTGDPATGFRLVGPVSARGAGTLPDLAAATAQDVANAINAGWLADGAGAALDEPVRGVTAQPLLPYDFAGDAIFTLTSRRRGAEGTLRRIAPAASPAWLDETLADGPAVRAALVTKPLPEAGARISGTLALVLNDNGSAAGLPAREAVSVAFADATWKAPEVAAAINAALGPRGLGFARAHADRRVVIEVAATGVAGSIAATRPASPAAPDPFGVLIEESFAADRGWPGAGRMPAGAPVPAGWRAAHANAAAKDASWDFALVGTPPTPLLTFPVAKNATQAAIADALDTALSAVMVAGTAQRIGVARLDPAGHLLVESLDHPVTLAFGGATPTDPGMVPGAQWEAPVEPALGLVPTHRPRTLRLARDPDGRRAIAGADDWGWIRLPTAPDGFAIVNGVSLLNAKANGRDGTADHEIAQLPLFPPGRWYVAARAEAARDAAGAYLPLVSSGRGLAALRTWPGMTRWGRLAWFSGTDRNTFDIPHGDPMPMLRAVLLPDGTAAAEVLMPMP